MFAASTNSTGDQSRSDLIGAIAWVVVPTLVIGGISLGIYAWLRRNKSTLSRLFHRRFRTGNPSMLRHTSTTLSPPPARTANRSERRREEAPPPEPQPNTLESISLKDLKQVLSLREQGRIREYYEAIAMVVKRYVSEKYQIKVLDATTGQILESLPHDLTDSVVDHVGEILRTCDMIHFSRHRPSRSELDAIYRTAKEFLESQIVVASPETDESEEGDDINELFERYRRMM